MTTNPNIDGVAYIDENSIIRRFYPLAGNENAIGLDLMTRPAAPFVERAIRERRITLNDPVVNVMGNLAITARGPLYRGDKFLGMVEAVFNITSLMNRFDNMRDNRFDAQLFDSTGKQFWGAETIEGEVSSTTISLEDNSWTILLGWADEEPKPGGFVIGLLWGGGGVLLLSILFIINRTWTSNARLSRSVSEKTAELEMRNRQLKEDADRRRQADQSLEESNKRLQDLVDNAAMLVYMLDVEGRLILVNHKMEELFGMPREKLVGMTREEFMPRETAEAHRANDLIVIKGKKPHYFEEVNEEPDGTHIYQSTKFPLFDQSGTLYAVCGISTDITESKRAEELATAERRQAQQYLDIAGVMIATLNVSGEITLINKKGCDVLEYSDAAELLGSNWFDMCLPEKDREEVRAVFNKLIAGDIEPVEYYENYVLTRSGAERMIAFHNTFLLDPASQCTGILFSGEDITERKHIEEQLLQAQKMESIGRLAGGVAHDFNNYLTAIEGYIDLTLLDLPESSSSERKNLMEARLSAERAANLTRQLLLFSRCEPLELKLLKLDAIVHDLLKMLDRLIGEQYSIISSSEDDLPLVKADAGQTEQVLMNLVVNARDAMPDGGEIRIGTEKVEVDDTYVQAHSGARTGRFVRLFVSDTGIGMDADTVSHIFEPFFSTKEKGHGTGLGLSVAYGIIAQHGGWIDVESKPGSGSTFGVFLSAVPMEAAAVDVESVPADALRGHGESILLVEDEEPVRVMVEKMLSGHGYEVTSAATAEEALDLFEKESGGFEMVFSDMILPGMNGVRLVDRLIELKPGIRVLLASGFSEGFDLQKIRDQGYAFMEKPYALTDLLRLVRELLEEAE